MGPSVIVSTIKMKLKTEIVKNKFVVIETDSIGKEYSRLDTV